MANCESGAGSLILAPVTKGELTPSSGEPGRTLDGVVYWILHAAFLLLADADAIWWSQPLTRGCRSNAIRLIRAITPAKLR